MVRSVTGMKKKKTRNPLIRRIPRELAGDWRKYLLVSLFLILTIGFVSGMYVANESMMKAADEGVTKYKLEDGHFELNEEADQTLLAAIATGERTNSTASSRRNLTANSMRNFRHSLTRRLRRR